MLNNSFLQHNKSILPVIWHFIYVLFQIKEFPFWFDAIIYTFVTLISTVNACSIRGAALECQLFKGAWSIYSVEN